MANRNDRIESAIFLDIADDAGVVATHPEQIEFPNRVATSLEGDNTHNTIKPFLLVVGCALAPDNHFQFDSSFVTPDAKRGMKRLARLFADLTDPTIDSDKESDKTPPLSIFGHADPVGSNEYNSILSARRARAVFGMLIRDAKIWESLFSRHHPMGGDVWGPESLQTMIEEVGFPPGGPVPDNEKDMKAAVKKAEQNPNVRKDLFLAYMDAICVKQVNGKEEKFALSKDNFLARGADKVNGKGDLQGCGEFNPVFLQSQETIDRFNKLPASSPEKPILEAVRNAANARDRRVLIFLFKPGSIIDPKKWPCPHVNDGNAVEVCKKRFWSDGKERRLKPDPKEEREFKKTQDTFACRFYHGIAQNSPCDGIHKQWVLRVLEEIPREDQNPVKPPKPLANKRFLAIMSDVPEAPRIRGRTDENGVLRLPVLDEVVTITLKIEVGDILLPPGVKPAPPSDPKKAAADAAKEEENFMTLILQAGDLKVATQDLKLAPGEVLSDEKKLGVRQRLHNLGYGPDKVDELDGRELTNAVKAFQRHHRLTPSGKETGVIDGPLVEKLREVHETLPKKAAQPTNAPSPAAGA